MVLLGWWFLVVGWWFLVVGWWFLVLHWLLVIDGSCSWSMQLVVVGVLIRSRGSSLSRLGGRGLGWGWGRCYGAKLTGVKTKITSSAIGLAAL